jgi:hypothetical protein
VAEADVGLEVEPALAMMQVGGADRGQLDLQRVSLGSLKRGTGTSITST